MNRRTYLTTCLTVALGSGCTTPSRPETPIPAFGKINCETSPPRTTTPAGSSNIETLSGSWVTTNFDVARTSANPDATPVRDCPQVQWRTRVGSTPSGDNRASGSGLLYGSPVIINGTVYVADNEAALYAIDGGNGQVNWYVEHGRSGIRGITYHDGVIYAGTARGLQAISVRDRAVQWYQETASVTRPTEGIAPPAAAPTVADGIVFVASGRVAAAFDTTTGRRLWRTDMTRLSGETTASTQNGISSLAEPAFADATLYAAESSGAVTALAMTDGIPRWTATLPTPVSGGLCVGPDIVYATTSQDVYALSREDGRLQWQLSNQIDAGTLTVRGAPAYSASSGRLIINAGVSSAELRTLALDAVTGQVVWRSVVGLGATAEVSLGGGLVVVPNGEFVLGLNPSTGAIKWGLEAPTTSATCAIVDGTVVVSDFTGHVYTIA